MTVHLDTAAPGDVAVLRGLDTDAAVIHLCRSLALGTAFDVYRGLVIDLGGRALSAEATCALEQAAAARLRRRQLVSAATDSADAAGEVRRLGAWLRRTDPGPANSLSLLRSYAGMSRSLAEAGVRAGASCARSVTVRAGRLIARSG
jgi:hypothetical protein